MTSLEKKLLEHLQAQDEKFKTLAKEQKSFQKTILQELLATKKEQKNLSKTLEILDEDLKSFYKDLNLH